MVLIIDVTLLRSDVCNIRYDEEVKLQPKHDNKQRNDQVIFPFWAGDRAFYNTHPPGDIGYKNGIAGLGQQVL